MQNLEFSPVSGPVTEQEKNYAINALRSTQIALHQSLDGLTKEQLAYKSATDRWSIAECVEHIKLVETGLFEAIKKGMTYPADPAKRAEIKVSDIDVIKAVRSRAVTLLAPDPFMPTGRFGSASEALTAFDRQRAIVIDYLQTVTEDLRTHYFKHIALGWLDIYQAILVMASHSERHRKQIEEVKTSSYFPI